MISKIDGPAYHAASMVVAAIDGFACFLSGERYHFSAGGSAPSEPRRVAASVEKDEGDPAGP